MRYRNDCYDSNYDPDMMMDEMYGQHPCGCQQMPMYPMYPMHPMMHQQMPPYPMPYHPMMGMPPEMMPAMMGMPMGDPEMMMPAMMPGMAPGMMPPMMGMPMGDPEMMMPVMMPGMAPGMMPPMMGMPMTDYPDEDPVVGLDDLDDFFEDEDPNGEDYENFLDIMNAQYPDLSEEAKHLLKELMEIDFSIIDFNLYLNTHPDDRRALAQRNRCVCMRKPLVQRLEQLYGPLTPMTKAGYPWTWLNQPWPWRIEY